MSSFVRGTQPGWSGVASERKKFAEEMCLLRVATLLPSWPVFLRLSFSQCRTGQGVPEDFVLSTGSIIMCFDCGCEHFQDDFVSRQLKVFLRQPPQC